MESSDEKLDKIIALLEEGNRLRSRSLELAEQSFRRTAETLSASHEIQERYKKHVFPILRWIMPVTVFIIVLILFLVYTLVSLIY